MAKILAPARYPWSFNSPKASRHDISVRNFVPFNKLSERIEGFTIFNPAPLKTFDLVHAFNRIPIGPTPFVISFESHLPRAFGAEHSAYFRWLTQTLVSPQCRGIVAISRFAERMFRYEHQATPMREALFDKLSVRYPNLAIPEGNDPLDARQMKTMTVSFVGNHFGRKGGCVAARLAELAHQEGFPLRVIIVSKLECGGDIWTDPKDRRRFAPYLELLSLPNVEFHHGLVNADVIEVLKRSHLSILTTLSDTFGYSAIEAMANHVPVVATPQGALSEFIHDGVNGLIVDLDLDAQGEWIHVARKDRATEAFARVYFDEIERLAVCTLQRLKALYDRPDDLASLRINARKTAKEMFDARDAVSFWDDYYDAALAGPRTARFSGRCSLNG